MILRLVLHLINFMTAFLALGISGCVTLTKAASELSAAGLDYSLMSRVTFNLWNIHIPFYSFDIKGYFSAIGHDTVEIYKAITLRYLLPFAIAGVIWLIGFSIIARIIPLFYNRKTTLHGSSRWMTESEMRKAGMLNKAGFVLGETSNTVFKERKTSRPKRKRGELESDYEVRLEKWNPNEKELYLEEPGDLIAQNGNAHTLVVGSTRSGKGVSCIIPTEFNWNESMIVLDPKSEGWGISANYRSKFSYTFKFEPEKPKQSIHYNPLLSIRRGRQTIPDIQNLSYILIPLNENAKDPFWDNEARKLLTAVMGYVVYCEAPERKTFRQVYSIFTAPLDQVKSDDEESEDDAEESMVKKYLRLYANNATEYIANMETMPPELEDRFSNRHKLPAKERETLEAEAQRYLTQDDKDNLSRIQQDLAYFAGCEERQLSSVVSTMMSNLHVIADPNVQEVTDRSDFVMEDFVQGIIDEKGVRHPISLYLCVSLASMKRLMPLMRMFYEQAITLLTRELRKNPYRLLLVFDEFYQMGKMEVVEKALALTAGYGVLCAVVIQSYDQLQKLYQSEATFTDNFAYQVILRVNEQKTCEKISAMLGKETKKQKKMGTSGSIYSATSSSSNFNVEQLGRELMTAEEVRTMGDNDCLIFSSGNHPYKAKKVRYYLDERFRRFYLDKRGNVLPPPDKPEDLEENQPHPDAVEKYKAMVDGKEVEKTRRIGIDDEGWHLLLGFDSEPAETEIDSDERLAPVHAEDDMIQEEIIDPDGDSDMEIDADTLNEMDCTLTEEQVKDLMGLTDFVDQCFDPEVVSALDWFNEQKAAYEASPLSMEETA